MFKLIFWALACACLAGAEVGVPPLFADHMVLQQKKPVPVWGTAAPGESVTVRLGSQAVSARADEAGHWRVTLPSLAAGGPFTLTVAGGNTLTFSDVLVGEVWIASGQSNMAFPLSGVLKAEAEVAAANHPRIRVFSVPVRTSLTPLTETEGKWELCASEVAGKFSGVAYFFARGLQAKLGVPIGVIDAYRGATPAEPWTSREALDRDPELHALAEKQIADLRALPKAKEAYLKGIADWEAKYHASDPGDSGFAAGWAKPNADLKEWKPALLPSTPRKLGLKRGGAIWLRREVDIADPKAKGFAVNLGNMDQAFTAYFNGVQIGKGGTDLEGAVERNFRLPASLLKAGSNTLAVRVFFRTPARGHFGDVPLMALRSELGTQRIDGPWLYRTEVELPELDQTAVASLPTQPRLRPETVAGTLYNGMIHPLHPFAMRGVIWYQGEGNAGRGEQYKRLFPLTIQGWRSLWKEEFPFYFVQLANYRAPVEEPGESNYAELREAQAFTAKTVPNTGMSVTIDIGEADTIHPRDKQNVGHRLALIALAKTYGQAVEYQGPTYQSTTVEKDAMRVRFSPAGGGLKVRGGGMLKQFAIAGADGKFVWAEARIEGDTVVVRSPNIPAPVAVRYAWAENPEGCNLWGANGLPAPPFRTDRRRGGI